MNQIKKVLESIYSNKELRTKIVPLFMSKPGLGKSNIIEDFMREKGVWKPPFVLSQRMPFEISGMALVCKETDRMKYYDFDFILDLKDGDILFIDEVTSSNPITLNAFLTFLESRVLISGKSLANIMIVGAGNYEGMSPLTPQIKQRFLWYDCHFEEDMFKAYIQNKYEVTDGIAEKLSKLIKGEDFAGYNFFTPRSIDKAIEMLILEASTPYYNKMYPILSELIENSLPEAVKLSEDKELAPGELISWLELIRYKRNLANTHKPEVREKSIREQLEEFA